ncbi:hypothetical protein [Dyella flagellata]|uniref:Uncharacterized protein n=1 Tax=Dyella flagellata TaxID=1867833 RepID=A0ABQ5X8K1_9GAMM|nr:hypothetical protein [Dyella flagellata]GLQ87959.1 hypothetical protein GCM10007898_15270 [Dyella flagellata]
MKIKNKLIPPLSMAIFSMLAANVHADDAQCIGGTYYTGYLVTLDPVPNNNKEIFKATIKTTDGKNTYTLPVDENIGPRTRNGNMVYATLLSAGISGNKVDLWCNHLNKISNAVIHFD